MKNTEGFIDESHLGYPANISILSALLVYYKELQKLEPVELRQVAMHCHDQVVRRIYELASRRIDSQAYDNLAELQELVMLKNYMTKACPDVTLN